MNTHPLDPEMTAEQYAVRDISRSGYSHHKLKRDACADLMKRIDAVRKSKWAIKIIAEFGLKPEDVYQVSKSGKTWHVEGTYKHYVAARLQHGQPVRFETVKALGLIGVDNHQVINNCYVKPT